MFTSRNQDFCLRILVKFDQTTTITSRNSTINTFDDSASSLGAIVCLFSRSCDLTDDQCSIRFYLFLS
jgi:hypothetical protein